MDDLLIIGLDGGATKISGRIITKNKNSGFFETGTIDAERRYATYGDFDSSFTPVPIDTQIEQLKTRTLLTDDEYRQGFAYKQAAADVLIELMRAYTSKKAIVGIGMPGLKTLDKRGIAVLANGPRMPGFSDSIEKKLKKHQFQLHTPIARLGSDADYCGIGEEYATQGMFRNCKNAYYLGGGTGVADALKLDGQLIPFDHIKPWMAKSWEMKSPDGFSLEKYASARGIQFFYSLASQIPLEKLDEQGIYPDTILNRAHENEPAARQTIHLVSQYIAALLFERIGTLYYGWSESFYFVSPAKSIEIIDHPFRRTLLEKIVLGQRLGDLIELSKTGNLLWQDILDKLTRLVKSSKENEFRAHYLSGDRFDDELIHISKLREAPAIGAGIDAFLNCKELGLC